MPGFSKALARTLHELRLAGIAPVRLKPDPADAGVEDQADDVTADGETDAGDKANADIGRLLARVEEQLARAGVDDRAALFRVAAEACRAGAVRWAESPIVLLDVPIDSRAEQEFVAALVERSPDVLATVPDGDHFARAALVELGGQVEEIREVSRVESSGSTLARQTFPDLPVLRSHIFSKEPPPARERAGDVRLFSAPGEGREAVEIVRRVLDEAARGVPFDEMAVCLRTPQSVSRLARARVRARRRAGVFRSRHASARSGRPRVRRAVVVRGRGVVGETVRRVSVARTGAGGQSTVDSRQSSVGRIADRRLTTVDCRQSLVWASPGDSSIVSPGDEVFHGLEMTTDGSGVRAGASGFRQ